MDTSLRHFISQFTGVVLASLAPVAFIAFMSIPYALGGHPGAARPANAPVSQHMT